MNAIAALAVALLLGGPPAPVPSRDSVVQAFRCPDGAQRMGAAPPDGFEVWCELPEERPERRRQGPALSWYDDGGLAKATSFDHGRLEGLFFEWYRNGKPARAGRYRDDRREGTWRIWFESGRLEEECGWDHGVQQGSFETWWPDGKRRVEGRYCRGLQCGTWTNWDESGHELGKSTFEEIRGTP